MLAFYICMYSLYCYIYLKLSDTVFVLFSDVLLVLCSVKFIYIDGHGHLLIAEEGWDKKNVF